MDLKDNPKRKGKWRKAFVYSFQGLIHATSKERNLQFHIVFAIAVLIFGFIFSISRIEWLFVIISIFGVISLELINTAIERAVDLMTAEIHPLAKQAKDVSAAAVMVYAVMAVIIGIIIFGPRAVELLERITSW